MYTVLEPLLFYLCLIAGPDSLKIDPSYLTSAQALADYALLIRTLKADRGAEVAPLSRSAALTAVRCARA